MLVFHLPHCKARLVTGFPHSNERVLYWRIGGLISNWVFLSLYVVPFPFRISVFPGTVKREGGGRPPKEVVWELTMPQIGAMLGVALITLSENSEGAHNFRKVGEPFSCILYISPEHCLGIFRMVVFAITQYFQP